MQTTKKRNSARPVPSTDMARNFGDYLAQVRYGHRSFLIEKNNKPVAELRPLGAETCTLREFVEKWKSLPADRTWADDLERVNRSDLPAKNPWA